MMGSCGKGLRSLLVWITAAVAVAGCAPQPASLSPSPTPGTTVQPASVAPSPSLTAMCRAADLGEEPSEGEVLVFFTCGSVPTAPVSAVARATDAEVLENRLLVALEQLVAGPTVDEQATGLRSWFSSDTAGALQEVRVDDAGFAEISFADFSTVIPNASTSAGQRQLLAELEATVFQFREVTSVELQFEGNCAAFWGWLQSTCAPLERPPS